MIQLVDEKKRIIVATHGEDIDGIASLALILKVYPDVQVIFSRPADIKRVMMYIDIVLDLPKPRNCGICIDHHESNYRELMKRGMLTDKDLVDPKAPSAACLVAKYFGLNDDVAREIVDMANKADTGRFDEELVKLDLFIKTNISDKSELIWLAKKLSELGKAIFDDEEYREKLKKLGPVIEKSRKVVEIAKSLAERGLKFAIFDATRVPYAISRAPASVFVKNGGFVAISFYIEPDTGRRKVSIRVGEYDFKANEFASRFGGGGHRKAAGVVLRSESKLAMLIKEFVEMIEYPIIFVQL